ncbi:MAG: KpsF/GutQ family sugar-phosphate isomerase [Saprospiraceae bacterium]|nr:KpsF/GutQ family sugar-phosphate isomerase [Saprospiraceae bacterium]
MNSDALIVKTAQETLEIEAQCLQALSQSIDQDFVACVNAIYSSPGRLVVTGIGKSALIAQKIVATLNSTGTPALFMHAADAIHGDLGMVRPYDLVLCLSKSGETAEIKVLVPLVRNLGNPIIGMVTKRDSYLGQQANYILHTPIVKEADPNNLAPTTSTTAQLALGDALATALLALRGFTPKDFAQFHPGGSLGKQLYLSVADIYPKNERPAVAPTDSLQRTILEMTSKCLGATAVVDEHDHVKGIVTDGDLRRMLEDSPDLQQLTAANLMSATPKTISKDALAVNALNILRKHSITQLIVEEDGKYLGMIHLHNLVKEGLI